MRRGIRWGLVSMVVLAGTTAVSACSDSDAAGGPPTTSAAPGQATYTSICASCHGADGRGGQGPAIGRGLAAAKYDRAELIRLVTKGKGAMPAFASSLSADEIEAVTNYVRRDLGEQTAPTTTSVDPGTSTGRRSLHGVPPELRSDDGSNWASPNGDLRATRAHLRSPITTKTVDRLELAWTYEVPGGATFGNLTTTPLVVDDSVYVGDLTTRVHAVDRDTGRERFVVGDDASIFGPTGVGIGWGRLFGTKANAQGRGSVVVAYDAKTGKERWATDIGGNGGDINMQPTAYDGLVFAATSGYGAGTKATIYALDAATGDVVWRFVVVADEDLWGHPELNSGGGVWYPPTIDAERGIAYFGTGNPYPFPGAKGFPNGASRPGANRWTDSIVALRIKTGKLVWGSQAIAHDIFDRDAMLTGRVDVQIGSKRRALAISTGKLGVVRALDADTGELVWKASVGTHRNDQLTEITGKTLVYPGSLGGVQTPLAVAGNTIYLCVMNAPTEYAGPEETSYGFTVQLGTANSQLVALDARTGKVRWDAELPGDSFGGATVSGDLVFTSSFGGKVLAFDRSTGEEVWSYQAPGGINGWPAVAGDQLFVPVGMATPPKLLAFKLSGN